MFVAHARNYLDVEPRLSAPVYAPEAVADAILHAGEHPRRDIYVDAAARLLRAGAHHLPGILDWDIKRLMFRLQRSEHNRHRPGEDLLEREPADWRVHETSWYTQAVTHPKARSALWLGAALGILSLMQARRARSR